MEAVRHFKIIFTAIVFGLLSQQVYAESDLSIELLQGDVSYRNGSAEPWRALGADTPLMLPAEVKTGDDGIVTLAQGGSSFVIREKSHVALSTEGVRSLQLVDRVKHWFGTVIYQIERNPDEFEVETPFLAATVKGTRFVIVADEVGSVVTLEEGSLQVRDLATGDIEMMVPGDVIGAEAPVAAVQNGSSVVASSNGKSNGLNRVRSAASDKGRVNRTIGAGVDGQSVAAVARQQGFQAQQSGREFGQSVAADANLHGITTSASARAKHTNKGSPAGDPRGNPNRPATPATPATPNPGNGPATPATPATPNPGNGPATPATPNPGNGPATPATPATPNPGNGPATPATPATPPGRG